MAAVLTSQLPLVETLNAWSTLGAAIATSVSAALIAWQIMLTRKTLQSTQQAVDVAMAELEHSRQLQVESQRSAIDAEMPKLFVTVIRDVHGVGATDDREEDLFAIGGTRARPMPAGTQFTLPRDANVRLEVLVSVSIANDGPRRAKVTVGARHSAPRWSREVIVGVGDEEKVTLSRAATVEEWVAASEKRARGEDDNLVVADVTYIFPGDTGATEWHEIVQGGSVLEPVSELAGTWRVKDVASVHLPSWDRLATGVQPFTREYWSSRFREKRL